MFAINLLSFPTPGVLYLRTFIPLNKNAINIYNKVRGVWKVQNSGTKITLLMKIVPLCRFEHNADCDPTLKDDDVTVSYWGTIFFY